MEEDDLPLFVCWVNTPEWHEPDMGFFVQPPIALEQQFSEHGFMHERVTLFVIETLQEEVVGSCEYFDHSLQHSSAEIGVVIWNPANRGQGYGAEAHRLLVDYLFTHLNLHRVQAQINPDNVPERRILEKLGFRLEGVRRRCWYAFGCWWDRAVYGLLRDEWQAEKDFGTVGGRQDHAT